MTANLYAWEPRLTLNPKDRDFDKRVGAYDDPGNRKPPSQVMRRFVAELLKRYPDITSTDDDDASAWADGPLIRDASDGFINVSIVWDRYDEAARFFLATAKRLGLEAYDPQDGRFYPSSAKSKLHPAVLGIGLLGGEPDRRAVMVAALASALDL